MRAATNKILEMIDEGLLDMKYVLTACLGYMSEDDVEDMVRVNDLDLTDGPVDYSPEWDELDEL